MGSARAIAGIPAGRRTKWLVLVFWLVVVAVAGPLSGKLTGAEKNDAQSWLPPKAESTQVLNLRSRFVSPNVYPAVVVYDRPAGLTAADKAKAAADASTFAHVAGVVPGQVAAPFAATDGKAIETIVAVNLGSKGWNGAGTAADALRSIAQANSSGLTVHIAGPLGPPSAHRCGSTLRAGDHQLVGLGSPRRPGCRQASKSAAVAARPGPSRSSGRTGG